MPLITDLHIHSRYSRACSKNLTFPNLAAWASAKGIDVLGTSDFTHPAWRKEIDRCLEPAEDGLFRLRAGISEGGEGYEAAPKAKAVNGERGPRAARFMLTTEVSCIYRQGGKTRRLHLLVFAPTLAAADRIIAALERRGCNLRADGRPIIGLSAKEVMAVALEADARCMVVPAHAWTPWYSVFGSMSGFDSLEECFEELTPYVHAIETGLSSDPLMNRRISALDGVMLISNSDAHGLRNLGREANAFALGDTPLSYDALMNVLRNRDSEKFPYTIEFFPEEGKYHADGHATCGFSCEPAETLRLGGMCPRCGKPLVRGVLGRVHALADRKVSQAALSPHRSIVPLEEIIGEALGVGKASKKVGAAYRMLLEGVGSEFHLLLDAQLSEISAVAGERVAEGVRRVREGSVRIRPGYDGVYGTVAVFGDDEVPRKEKSRR